MEGNGKQSQEDLLVMVVGQLEKLNTRLEQTNAKLDETSAKLDQTREELSARIDTTNAKLDQTRSGRPSEVPRPRVGTESSRSREEYVANLKWADDSRRSPARTDHSMNSAPPPTSRLQVPEAVAEQLVADATLAITGWIARTREHGLRIPFVSDLLQRLVGPI